MAREVDEGLQNAAATTAAAVMAKRQEIEAARAEQRPADEVRLRAELAPLDAAAPEHAAVVAAIRAAKARHEASVAPVPSQTERLPSKLTDLPCCGVGAEGSWAHAWAVLTNGCGC